ncbi:sulfatase-like hydrolase/transferase [uncultured Sulfitobacter sp.]|uniref:sulfatase-like hydrolase/transferase n=1 Tax=uncultured Sulfitobacter sp. TaxID=191468 RepID=UPI0026301BD8|nr:sulfatase-like hydrolase/transferase [uncultured Sulfitobacter sp.]
MTSNLLVILSDEHQARAMGCAGHPFVQTPNLDALAARGMRFTDAYTPSPICVPARASFATGQYAHQNRLWDNAMPYHGQIPGWGHCLQNAGIPVESIGKLHYRQAGDPAGFDHEHIPMHVAGGVGMVWGSIRETGERITPAPRMLGEHIGAGTSKYTDYDQAVTDRTVEWLADHAQDDAPWCLYVGLVAPHFPLVVPQEFFDLYPPDSLPSPKMNPNEGYKRHPWVELQNAQMDSEARFKSEAERRDAVAAYYGLVTWMDHNVGRIMTALEQAGLSKDTTVIYSSDHGDNLGARGLWGKSNLYQESVSVPLIMAGPDIAVGTCATPVDLLDISATIPAHFGLTFDCAGKPLTEIAAQAEDPDRVIFSEYHAVGAVSAAYMLRKGRYKLNTYIGFETELFDLMADPEEATNLAGDPAFADVIADLTAELQKMIDPETVNAQAFADQDALIAHHGGREAALKLGATGATPPPAT